jgi:hypothetical protein
MISASFEGKFSATDVEIHDRDGIGNSVLPSDVRAHL